MIDLHQRAQGPRRRETLRRSKGEDYCSQFKSRGKEGLTELDLLVANDSLENEPYTEETKWMLRRDLYRKLDENEDLLDSVPMMAEFYDNLQGSSTAAFKVIDEGQLALYDLDSSLVEQLSESSAEVDSLRILVQENLEQLGDSTLTSEQRHAIVTGISGYRQSIGEMSADNSASLELVAESKSIVAEDARTENSGIAITELIESNQKTVNEVYLVTIGKDVDAFTTAQASDLLAIANQCPLIGGNAVFKARSLYGLIDDAQEFDDSLLCVPLG